MIHVEHRPMDAVPADGRGGGLPIAPAARAATFVVDLVGPGDLDNLADEWRDLAARAVESNPLYAYDFAAAAIAVLADAGGVRVAAIWRIEPAGARLVGIVPFVAARLRWGVPLRLVAGLAHNYGPLGVPLLDRDHAAAAAGGFLDWLRRRPVRARFLLLPFLTEDGPCAEILRGVLAQRRLRHRAFGRFERALARPGPGEGATLDRAVDPKRRRDLARTWRQLQALGSVEQAVVTRPDGMSGAVEAFLALEMAGWKGKAGTASLQRADRAAFVRAAVTGMAAAGQARVHVLSLDGRPIAVGIAYVAGPRACFWKIAYDERFARHSPGVQVALAVTRDLLAQPGVVAIDSLADPGHPMIDRLWRERLPMADWLVDLSPGGSPLMTLAGALEGARRSARLAAKSLVGRLRGTGARAHRV